MDRNELTLVIAGALVGAFLLGWIFRWIFGRINAPGPAAPRQHADMAAQLHAAEEARHRAETLRDEVEAAAARQVAKLRGRAGADPRGLRRRRGPGRGGARRLPALDRHGAGVASGNPAEAGAFRKGGTFAGWTRCGRPPFRHFSPLSS